jgi:hypothetical protein
VSISGKQEELYLNIATNLVFKQGRDFFICRCSVVGLDSTMYAYVSTYIKTILPKECFTFAIEVLYIHTVCTYYRNRRSDSTFAVFHS